MLAFFTNFKAPLEVKSIQAWETSLLLFNSDETNWQIRANRYLNVMLEK